ncbi:hypothetical protein BH23ACT4_BH23ACT4_08810 [soil metagenome]
MAGNYELRLQSLIDRLQMAEAIVYEVVAEQQDSALISSLEDGSYGSRELDLLFDLVEKPLLASALRFAGVAKSTSRYEIAGNAGEDIFLRAILMLAERSYFKGGLEGRPEIDLLSGEPEDRVLGRQGAAQLGLVRRLVRRHGLESLDTKIELAAIDPDRVRCPQVEKEAEVARLLRVIAPIERDHVVPILTFLSPTGREVPSTFSERGTQASPKYYMGVDK